MDKIYLYAKDLSEPKYENLIRNREDVRIKQFHHPNAFECTFIEYTMNDVYQNFDSYNPSREREIFIVFDDMIADIMSNKISQNCLLVAEN